MKDTWKWLALNFFALIAVLRYRPCFRVSGYRSYAGFHSGSGSRRNRPIGLLSIGHCHPAVSPRGRSMLQDDYIRDWIVSGAKDPAALIVFMDRVRKQFNYDLIDASIVDDLNETYYGTDGRILRLSPLNQERDGWYYVYRETVDGRISIPGITPKREFLAYT
jgi:hypothetical protein